MRFSGLRHPASDVSGAFEMAFRFPAAERLD